MDKLTKRQAKKLKKQEQMAKIDKDNYCNLCKTHLKKRITDAGLRYCHECCQRLKQLSSEFAAFGIQEDLEHKPGIDEEEFTRLKGIVVTNKRIDARLRINRKLQNLERLGLKRQALQELGIEEFKQGMEEAEIDALDMEVRLDHILEELANCGPFCPRCGSTRTFIGEYSLYRSRDCECYHCHFNWQWQNT